MDHHCTQEKRIEAIEKILIIGNGQPSILSQMATLATNQKNIHNSVMEISNDVKSLLTYKDQTTGAISYKGKVILKNRWLVATIIALSSIILTIVAMILME